MFLWHTTHAALPADGSLCCACRGAGYQTPVVAFSVDNLLVLRVHDYILVLIHTLYASTLGAIVSGAMAERGDNRGVFAFAVCLSCIIYALPAYWCVALRVVVTVYHRIDHERACAGCGALTDGWHKWGILTFREVPFSLWRGASRRWSARTWRAPG